MSHRQVVNNILIALLSAAFVYTFISSFIKLGRDEIGSKTYEKSENFPHRFPSLVICPWIYNRKSNVPEITLKNNFTLEDIEKLPRIQDLVTVEITVKEEYSFEK